ncbi:MAG: hypothetical protein ABF577_12535, partial [Acetobacter sp.]
MAGVFARLARARQQARLHARLQTVAALRETDPCAAFAASVDLAGQGVAQAMFFVAQAYLSGQGAPPDLAEGLRWCLRAAADGWADARFTLAVLCLHGLPEGLLPGLEMDLAHGRDTAPRVFGGGPSAAARPAPD